MQVIYSYIRYIRDFKRYSDRTVQTYERSLLMYVSEVHKSDTVPDKVLLESLNVSEIRSYMASLMEEHKMVPKSVRLHMSVLSSFCAYLVKEGKLESNPVRRIRKPKVEKRLPEYYRDEAMTRYFQDTEIYASEEYLAAFMSSIETETAKDLYESRLSRLIISFLYSTGVRRSELIKLDLGSVDFGRKVVKVHGKGNKMREIPLVASLCEEILLGNGCRMVG